MAAATVLGAAIFAPSAQAEVIVPHVVTPDVVTPRVVGPESAPAEPIAPSPPPVTDQPADAPGSIAPSPADRASAEGGDCSPGGSCGPPRADDGLCPTNASCIPSLAEAPSLAGRLLMCPLYFAPLLLAQNRALDAFAVSPQGESGDESALSESQQEAENRLRDALKPVLLYCFSRRPDR